MRVEIRLFGKFRKYESGKNSLVLDCPENMNVHEIKDQMKRYFREKNPQFLDDSLIEESAIANESRILSVDEKIQESCTLAILPPVCGG